MTARFLVDLSWPGTMNQHLASLHRADVPLSQLRMVLATCSHIDHAGLARDLERAGVPLLVPDVQVPWFLRLRDHSKTAGHLTEIALHGNRVIPIEDTRAVLAELHIDGPIAHTPGHSPDGVSLLLDDGSVFTGDLTLPMLMTEDQADEMLTSRDRLWQRAPTTVYAGHGPVRPAVTSKHTDRPEADTKGAKAHHGASPRRLVEQETIRCSTYAWVESVQS